MPPTLPPVLPWVAVVAGHAKLGGRRMLSGGRVGSRRTWTSCGHVFGGCYGCKSAMGRGACRGHLQGTPLTRQASSMTSPMVGLGFANRVRLPSRVLARTSSFSLFALRAVDFGARPSGAVRARLLGAVAVGLAGTPRCDRTPLLRERAGKLRRQERLSSWALLLVWSLAKILAHAGRIRPALCEFDRPESGLAASGRFLTNICTSAMSLEVDEIWAASA